MIEGGLIGISGQVEIGVVGKVDDGWLVCGCRGYPSECVFRKCVFDANLEISGVAFIAIWGKVGKNDRVFGYSFSFPNNLIEALETAVEVVWFVVDGELIVGAIDGKFPAGDAVGVAPYCGTEVIFIIEPLGFIFETEKNVGKFSITIRHGEGTQSCAEIADCG